MASRAVDLAIRMSVDASDVAPAFDDTGAAALRMSDDVDAASRQVDASASRLGGAADAADNLGSSSSQAAGGIGDLGGALSLMPGPLGAVGSGMEAVAPAIMGVTGAADLANLALASNVVQSTRARVAAVRQAVASRAVAAATRTWAAVQWVLNAAMSANPLGIVIAAIALLVAGVILAYKKSETFRSIVQDAMRVASAAVGWVIDKVQGVIDKVRDADGPIKFLKEAVVKYFELMTWPIRTVIGFVDDLIDKVQTLIGWIQDIDFPDIPDIPGFRTAASSSTTSSSGSGSDYAGAPTEESVTIVMPQLAGLTVELIEKLVAELDRYYRRKGQRVQVVAS